MDAANGLRPLLNSEDNNLKPKVFSNLEQALLDKLQEISANLTTYQSGAKAPSQIISNDEYVLKDAGEINKFKADLNSFMKGADPEKPRIKNSEDITGAEAQELLKFLKSKGYQERNIEADFQARILPSSTTATRENLGTLSKP